MSNQNNIEAELINIKDSLSLEESLQSSMNRIEDLLEKIVKSMDSMQSDIG